MTDLPTAAEARQKLASLDTEAMRDTRDKIAEEIREAVERHAESVHVEIPEYRLDAVASWLESNGYSVDWIEDSSSVLIGW